tara:strand:+ start:105 stop:629 length:525 start_codon:yes stop_codon:yes gene_type:complete
MPYKIGIPKMHQRRTNQVLNNLAADPIEYEAIKQDDGFYIFSFPGADEYDFKEIVKLLKANGINAIGADTALDIDISSYELNEKKIMKLADLIKEQPELPNPMESADDIIAKLEEVLDTWETKEYESDEARWKEYYKDIENIVVDFNENQSIDRDDPSIDEQKIRKIIRKMIRE